MQRDRFKQGAKAQKIVHTRYDTRRAIATCEETTRTTKRSFVMFFLLSSCSLAQYGLTRQQERSAASRPERAKLKQL